LAARREPGTRLAIEAILDGEATALTRKAIERAMSGDTAALRLCLERLAPPRRDRSVSLTMPALKRPEIMSAATAALLAAVAAGELTPGEGEADQSSVVRSLRFDSSAEGDLTEIPRAVERVVSE
jgi:hypothetical protein